MNNQEEEQEQEDSEEVQENNYQKEIERKVIVYEHVVTGLDCYRNSSTASSNLFYHLVNEVLVDKETGKEVVANTTVSHHRTKRSYSLDLKLKLSQLKNPLALLKLQERGEQYLWEDLPKKLWKKIDERLAKLSNHLYYRSIKKHDFIKEKYVFHYEKDGQVKGVELDCRRSYVNIHESSYGNLPQTVDEAIQKGFTLNEESKSMALFLLGISKQSWKASRFVTAFLEKVSVVFQAAMFLKYREELKNKKVVVCNLPNGTHVKMANNEAIIGKNYFDYNVPAYEFETVRVECLLTKLEE